MRRLLLPLIFALVSTGAFAQSDAQKSFDQLKSLAGSWEGNLDGQALHISLRVTSRGERAPA